MVTVESLREDLKNAGVEPNGTLLCHLSMKSIGAVENGADGVLDALCGYMREGLLVLPAHTWDSVNAEHPIFDARESRSCVGLLTDLFRKRPGVVRSLHPTHSLCALGRDAAEFAAGEERLDTPCGPESCYRKLERRDAQVLLVGVNFSRNTSVHCIEEVAGVSGRLTPEREPLAVRDFSGRLFPVPSHRHQNANSEYYVKLEPVMLGRGLLRRVPFGGADCLLVRERDLFAVTLELLAKNPRLFDDDAPVPEAWI